MSAGSIHGKYSLGQRIRISENMALLRLLEAKNLPFGANIAAVLFERIESLASGASGPLPGADDAAIAEMLRLAKGDHA